MALNISDIVFSVAGMFCGHSLNETINKPHGGEIYRIWFDNDPSGKSYVGQTIQGSLNRIRQHIEDARTLDGGCPLLDAATRKFGVHHMRYEILEQGIQTHEELDAAEKHWISKFNSREPGGYNVKSGGQRKSKSTPIVTPTKIHTTFKQRNPIVSAVIEGIIDNKNMNPVAKVFIQRILR